MVSIGTLGTTSEQRRLLRGRSDGNMRTKALARRRGSTRANRRAIRSIRISNMSCERSGSILWPAATV